MLLQLKNANQHDINKLLKFAQQNNLKLSVIEVAEDNYTVPGKPLQAAKLNQLIEKSRHSGMIAMEEAHRLIRSSFTKS